MDDSLVGRFIERASADMQAHAEELTTLDQAIGDGDHGINMKRSSMWLPPQETRSRRFRWVRRFRSWA